MAKCSAAKMAIQAVALLVDMKAEKKVVLLESRLEDEWVKWKADLLAMMLGKSLAVRKDFGLATNKVVEKVAMRGNTTVDEKG
jgi:hypothetical protein